MIDINNTNAKINNPLEYNNMFSIKVRLYPDV